MLFIFNGTFSHYTPVTADIFAKTLTKVSTKLGFPGIKPHNFKHGILTTLFEAVEQDLETVSQRMYLAVADHKPDYSQEYIVPDLRFIDRKLKRIRASSLNVFVADHTSQFVRVKGLLKRIFPKRLPNTHQIFLPITTQGTTRASHMLFVRLWCASMLEFPFRICNNCERNFCKHDKCIQKKKPNPYINIRALRRTRSKKARPTTAGNPPPPTRPPRGNGQRRPGDGFFFPLSDLGLADDDCAHLSCKVEPTGLVPTTGT
ncbi:MAG: hypothetical protein CMH98_01010 [Oceanospirillaceae bacterium]|nr:hypothetical protein [Oceanospirillaceae bacterium]